MAPGSFQGRLICAILDCNGLHTMQNIQSKTAIFYLFSNNYINEIVSMRFDFQDEEVLGHYITLLKSISLKLNSSTVQFFFDSSGSFPLYTEAIKLINHRDGMVRAAVRTLTLKVYDIQDPALQRFIVGASASHFFSDLAACVTEQCKVCLMLLCNFVLLLLLDHACLCDRACLPHRAAHAVLPCMHHRIALGPR